MCWARRSAGLTQSARSKQLAASFEAPVGPSHTSKVIVDQRVVYGNWQRKVLAVGVKQCNLLLRFGCKGVAEKAGTASNKGVALLADGQLAQVFCRGT